MHADVVRQNQKNYHSNSGIQFTGEERLGHQPSQKIYPIKTEKQSAVIFSVLHGNAKLKLIIQLF